MNANSLKPIGVLDSGMGGLTVVATARKLIPQEDLIFFGDLKNSPYGGRTRHEVIEIIDSAVDTLCQRGIKALVLACNTGTSAAAEHLRSRLPIPVIGMEPALKPAILAAPHGTILVLATQLTLQEEKFEKLFRQYQDKASIILKSCPGLVQLIDSGFHKGEILDKFLADLLKDVSSLPISAIVLGCTHYVIVKKAILNQFASRPLCIDGNEGVAKQIKNLLEQRGLLKQNASQERTGSLEIISSEPSKLHLLENMYRLLSNNSE